MAQFSSRIRGDDVDTRTCARVASPSYVGALSSGTSEPVSSARCDAIASICSARRRAQRGKPQPAIRRTRRLPSAHIIARYRDIDATRCPADRLRTIASTALKPIEPEPMFIEKSGSRLASSTSRRRCPVAVGSSSACRFPFVHWRKEPLELTAPRALNVSRRSTTSCSHSVSLTAGRARSFARLRSAIRETAALRPAAGWLERSRRARHRLRRQSRLASDLLQLRERHPRLARCLVRQRLRPLGRLPENLRDLIVVVPALSHRTCRIARSLLATQIARQKEKAPRQLAAALSPILYLQGGSYTAA